MTPFDIIHRLERNPTGWVCIRREAADRIKSDAERIKDLEAKLAIAVAALEAFAPLFENAHEDSIAGRMWANALAALAKIKELAK